MLGSRHVTGAHLPRFCQRWSNSRRNASGVCDSVRPRRLVRIWAPTLTPAALPVRAPVCTARPELSREAVAELQAPSIELVAACRARGVRTDSRKWRNIQLVMTRGEDARRRGRGSIGWCADGQLRAIGLVLIAPQVGRSVTSVICSLQLVIECDAAAVHRGHELADAVGRLP